jgi:hypothetical protein
MIVQEDRSTQTIGCFIIDFKNQSLIQQISIKQWFSAVHGSATPRVGGALHV